MTLHTFSAFICRTYEVPSVLGALLRLAFEGAWHMAALLHPVYEGELDTLRVDLLII